MHCLPPSPVISLNSRVLLRMPFPKVNAALDLGFGLLKLRSEPSSRKMIAESFE